MSPPALTLEALAASVATQAGQLDRELQALFMDCEACIRHQQPFDLPPAVGAAFAAWHPYYVEVTRRMRLAHDGKASGAMAAWTGLDGDVRIEWVPGDVLTEVKPEE